MSENLFEFGSNPAFERIERLSRRAENLPEETREFVKELLEDFTVSVEELQVAAEELNQQNAELAAARGELEIQRSRYHDMFELAPDGYLVTDPQGLIREANKVAVELLGVPRNELTKKPIALFVALGERDRFRHHLTQLTNRKETRADHVEWEVSFISRQGLEFPAALTVAPVKDQNGELTGLRWLLRDISESKRAAERERLLKHVREQYRSAQEANRLLHALIETMPVGAVISDANGMFLLTNTAGREILGSRISGSVNTAERPYSAYYPSGDPFPVDQTPLAIALKEKHLVRDVEVLIRRADGSERSLLASAAPILDEAGELLSGIAIFQDTTERKHAEEALLASQAELSAVIENMPVGIWIVDATGKVTTKNAAADLIWAGNAPLSNGKEAYVEYVAWDVETGKQLEVNDYPLAKTLQTGLAVAPVELRIRRFDGTEGIVLMSTVPLRSPDGTLTGAMGINIDITERKQAEEDLRESEEKYAAMFEKSAMPAALGKLPEGVFADVNEAFESTFGYTCQEILGKTSVDIGMVRYGERQQTYLDMERDGFVRESEKQFRTRSGETRDCLINVNPVKIHGEDFTITTIQDITERKKSRAALQRNAERMEALHEIDKLILVAKSEKEIGEAVLGYMPQMLDCPCANLTLFDRQTGQFSMLAAYPQDKPAICANLYAHLSEAPILAELSRGDIHVVEDVQDLHPVEWREALQMKGVRAFVSVPFMIGENLVGTLNLGMADPGPLNFEQTILTRKLASVVAIGLRQVYQFKQLQSYATGLEYKVSIRTGALRESEERFRFILETAVFGIALLDTKGRIVQSNLALQTMTGYSERELRGMAFSDYGHPDDAQADEELYKALASLETDHYQVEKRFIRKDGQVRWSALTLSRVKRPVEGRPWLAVAILEDITEKKSIQETLARSERLTLAGRLGASLAHEINNPVQTVIGCLGLADEMLEEGNAAHRYLDIAMQELERTADIVTQLRDLGRTSEPKPKMPTDLNAFIERILLLTRKRCQTQNVEVEWQPEATLPPVSLVPERMQQVLLNLILNALNAMEKGGQLFISTLSTDQPEGATITISDTGVGIEPERLVHIFEPFHSDRPDGLGLGLYISKSIVEEHGGRIGAESVPGEGATFTVWLPI